MGTLSGSQTSCLTIPTVKKKVIKKKNREKEKRVSKLKNLAIGSSDRTHL